MPASEELLQPPNGHDRDICPSCRRCSSVAHRGWRRQMVCPRRSVPQAE
jgi:hypothetical protein